MTELCLGTGAGAGLPERCSFLPFSASPPRPSRTLLNLRVSTLDSPPPGRPLGHPKGLWLRVLPLLDSAWSWLLPSAQGSVGPGTQGTVEGTEPSPGPTGPAYFPIKWPSHRWSPPAISPLIRALNTPQWGQGESGSLASNTASVHTCCVTVSNSLAHSVPPRLQAGEMTPAGVCAGVYSGVLATAEKQMSWQLGSKGEGCWHEARQRQL